MKSVLRVECGLYCHTVMLSCCHTDSIKELNSSVFISFRGNLTLLRQICKRTVNNRQYEHFYGHGRPMDKQTTCVVLNAINVSRSTRFMCKLAAGLKVVGIDDRWTHRIECITDDLSLSSPSSSSWNVIWSSSHSRSKRIIRQPIYGARYRAVEERRRAEHVGAAWTQNNEVVEADLTLSSELICDTNRTSNAHVSTRPTRMGRRGNQTKEKRQRWDGALT